MTTTSGMTSINGIALLALLGLALGLQFAHAGHDHASFLTESPCACAHAERLDCDVHSLRETTAAPAGDVVVCQGLSATPSRGGCFRMGARAPPVA